ncbi:NAD-dependent succinate-semialdehyde dehydrogenase [Corynebacterium ulcerans]|uniref:NAD-dependent succinate-semialdehyde dehydrogenase n=1 Tax=Corynebacterium ulcerans TaxID=65058 RepID=UPI000C764576|nr:NAD-dependent succinate-semialdehyde dehydrogenase [Corynebacterium ulcerans]PLV99211.1 NAD-dependent succinate-semialdehyde dehydrogenase [Corynebacterium ulcerans]
MTSVLLPEIPTGVRIGTHVQNLTETFSVVDPATEKELARVSDAGSKEWMHALDLADKAFAEWSAWSTRKRSQVLYEIFHAIEERRDDFARTMTLEMGKPCAEAQGEVSYGNEYFRWFAEESVRVQGRFSPAPSGNGHILTTHTPVGPVLAITPWNFPLAMATRKIAPALAAGCPVIVKPAAETPLTLLFLGSVISEVLERHDAPDGVFSVIPTTRAATLSQELMADARLRKVTFTGSTPVGKTLVRQSADTLQRTSMELGGNAPFVVHKDADLDLVVSCALQAKMRNGGEACIAANRFLVHEDSAEEFTRRLVALMEGFVLGHGLEQSTTLGPMITERQRDRIAELVADAVSDGAHIQCGGMVPDGPGYFYPATVLTQVDPDSRIMHEEIFGPVATITVFSDLAEAISLANQTQFGLAAYGFSENVHTAQRLAAELNAGMVGINRGAISDPAAPFGGVKESGFGREGGVEGIFEYLDIRYVAWQ